MRSRSSGARSPARRKKGVRVGHVDQIHPRYTKQVLQRRRQADLFFQGQVRSGQRSDTNIYIGCVCHGHLVRTLYLCPDLAPPASKSVQRGE